MSPMKQYDMQPFYMYIYSSSNKHTPIAINESKQPAQERRWLPVHQTDPKPSWNHHIECYKTPDEPKEKEIYTS